MTLRTMKQYMVSVVALAIVFISAAAASQNDFSKSNGMTRRGSYGKHHAAKWASEHSSHSPHSSHGSENDHYLVVETEQGKAGVGTADRQRHGFSSCCQEKAR